MKAEAQRKISYDDIRDVLKSKAEAKKSQDKILITVASVKYSLYEEKNIEVSRDTIRANGMCKSGYFEKKYSSCRYNHRGDPNRRGLLMKPQEFLEEVE